MGRELALAIVAASSILSCRPAQSPPTLAQASAVVVLGAMVVHAADGACAGAAKGLRDGGDAAGAAKLSGSCVAVLRPAFDSLLLAGDALDAGKAIAIGDVACAVSKAVSAVIAVRLLGVKLGATADHLLETAVPISAFCQGS